MAGGTIRLAGRVVYDDQRRAAEELWFDFPAEHAGALSSSGNPWLIALLPLAAATGEPLHLSAPVDPLLLRNSYELMAIWRAWYPEMRDAELDAKACEPEGRETAGRTASFFSGGVDSFFTAIRHASGGRGGRIDDLLTIHGFDIPLDREIEFARHREILGRAAGGLGKRLIVIRTNLKATRLREVPWGAIGHGCALASVGLCLESRYGTLLIPSTTSFSRLHPWGSHPLTDPLFSTSRMRVVHDGAAWDRFDKLEVVARSEIVRRSLHVCYRDKSDRNCGTCTKCLQTMIGLELAGALEACETFPRRDLDLDRVAQVHLVEGWEFMLLGE